MIEESIRKLLRARFFKYLNSSLAPHWLVLLTDMLIVLLCCVIAYIIKASIQPGIPFDIDESLNRIGLIMGVYFVFSIITRSYKCIVRFSAVEDILRVLLLVGVSTAVFIVVNIISMQISGRKIMTFWYIIFIDVLIFSALMLMRIVVKAFFSLVNRVNAHRERVIVLGSALNSYVFATALKEEINGSFLPVALLSLKGTTSDKSTRMPIIPFNKDTLAEDFAKHKASTLIFLSTQLDIVRDELADAFLQSGIKLLQLNQVEEFNADNEDPKKSISRHVLNVNIEELLGREAIKNFNPALDATISGRCVMITGAAGSIGSEIVRQVAAMGASDILLVDQAETPMHNMNLELNEKYKDVKTHLIMGDVTNITRMEAIFKEYHPVMVLHAAAYKHVPMMEMNPSEAILNNVKGTKIIADLSLKYNVRKFVMISTDKAVNPTNVMGASKRIAEIYVQSLFYHSRKLNDKCTEYITTRFGNVLGSNGSVVPLFRDQIAKGGPLTVTHKNIIRYFMTIQEACSLVLEAGVMGGGGEIYVFDMGHPVKIYDLAKKMITLAGFTPDKDIKIIETGLRPGEKLYEELLNDKETTKPTSHKKIMIAQVRKYDYDEVNERIDELISIAINGTYADVVLCMKHIVPEYISNNSKFESLDKIIAKENEESSITPPLVERDK